MNGPNLLSLVMDLLESLPGQPILIEGEGAASVQHRDKSKQVLASEPILAKKARPLVKSSLSALWLIS